MGYPLWSRRIDGKRTSVTERGPRHAGWRRAGALAIALAGWLALVAPPLHAQQCTNDLQGADDEPGQKDLDQFCVVGSCGGSNTAITWNFDDTVWTGSNTGDGCALFDDNGDGNADRAVCVTIQGAAQMQANNPKCYTCGNTRPDRCTNSVLGTCTTTCSVVLASDPFALDPNHVGNACGSTSGCPGSSTCCRNKDAQVDCCLVPADAGPGGVMIDVCSYPSQQPNSDPSDCTIARTCSKNNPNDPLCDDHNPCTVDSCDTTFGVCRHVAGNSGSLCRAAAGACDVAEYCTGTSIFCPPDQFAPQGGTCRNKSDACDVAESCSGTSADCPPDGVAPQGTVCRPSNGNQCDVAEVCDGTTKACPPDGSKPDNTPCDDSNSCTSGDKCVSGNCAGTPISCDDSNLCTSDSCDPATGCKHLNNNNPCDDHNACTTGDHCSGGSCAGGPPPNCDDNNVCTTDACNPASGCTHSNNTLPCDDGNACTTADKCSGGSCAGGPPPNCDDSDVCTDDSCNPATGCVHSDNTAPCNDGNACTTSDHCSSGNCVGGPPSNCNDSNGCTDDSCDPASGCKHVNNNDPCDDGSACTTDDHCSGGSCAGGPPPDCNDNNVCTTDGCNPASGCTHSNNTVSCNDGDACTTADKCSGGSCVGGPPPDCDDSNACTNESCDPATGCVHDPVPLPCCNTDADCNDSDQCTTNERCVNNSCVSDPVDCDDGNLCTDDSCNPASGCKHVNNNDPCDDGSACTTGDHCAGGSCAGGPPPDCNDNNVCTTDSCNPATGCVNTNNTAPCDDGSACTTNDTCAGGSCVGGPPPNCNDNDVCTDDSCNPATGCVHSDNTASCNDGNACTTNDHCSSGDCVGGPPPNCNDSNGCTDDSCDPASGCKHVNNNDPCDDGSACTTGDHCAGGSCAGGPPPDCNDNNVCTTDSCNPASGCTHANNTAPCDDGSACTTNDTCSGGSCVGGPTLNCNDNDPCTDDSCDPHSGCTHGNNSAPCDDGNPCTVNDVCSLGSCAPGPQKDCNDLNGCTDDTCNPSTGLCQHLDNSAPCDDGNVCTVGDHCFQGSCQSGDPKDCNDGNFCTQDTCTPQTDCQHGPVPPGCCNSDADCTDTDACTVNERCVNNQCVSDPRNCADDDPCTVDMCNNAGGGFLCVHTSCAQIDPQTCPNPSCVPPPPCGNGVLDPGETCDPPGSTPITGVTCRTDCTYCGDGVVQAGDGEACDDGNIAEGCNKRGVPIDGCQNNCTTPICKDPTKVLLAAAIDRFFFHGRLAFTSTVDFANNSFVVELRNDSGDVIFRRSLPPGSITSKSGTAAGPFKYTNAAASASGGISKLKIKQQKTQFYKATLVGYGNLLGSEDDMATHIHAGDGHWTVTGVWEHIGNLWRLIPPVH